jgi:periplasmic protein TonB
MWENTLIGSNVYSRTKSVWTVPLAALIHAGILFGIVSFSYWRVEAMEAPQDIVSYWSAIRVSIGPPPAYGHRQKPGAAGQTKSAEPVHHVQPSSVPPLTNNDPTPAEPTGNGDPTGDSGLPYGDPNGVVGGAPIADSFGAGGISDADPDEPQFINVNMTQPVLIRRVEPVYPKIALIGHLQGLVILQAVITRTGSVEEVKTMRADYPVLEKAAKDAVLQWQYKPATLRGQPVTVYFTVTVTFHLK